MTEKLPLIFNIHRLATEDGAGLRSTVFFKGCPLSCDWCHNPEAIADKAELAYFPELCIGCAACAAVCPEAAINQDDKDRLLRLKCTACGSCSETCPTKALRLVGKHYPVQELLPLLLRDRVYYRVSGGGVTFSGGEPTRYPDYLETALKALRGEGIHSAIQTCGHFDPAPFIKRILPLVDLVYFDLKAHNQNDHLRLTGRDNILILNTFSQLSRRAHEKIIPRIPLIPGRTDNRANLMALADFLRQQGYNHCDLLTYNPGGLGKRQRIGMKVPIDIPESLPDAELEEELRTFFNRTLSGQEVHSQ